jgi:hypothetical protein
MLDPARFTGPRAGLAVPVSGRDSNEIVHPAQSGRRGREPDQCPEVVLVRPDRIALHQSCRDRLGGFADALGHDLNGLVRFGLQGVVRIDLENPVGTHGLPVDPAFEDGAGQPVPPLERPPVEGDVSAWAAEVDDGTHLNRDEHQLA